MVHPALPAASVKELIALAKAKPGTINFGSSGLAGTGHLAGELFKMMAGINITHVPYKGAAPALIGRRRGRSADAHLRAFLGPAVHPVEARARDRRDEREAAADAARRAGDRRDRAGLRGGLVVRGARAAPARRAASSSG